MAQAEHLPTKFEVLSSNSGCEGAQACNSVYSGGRDQEDHGSKPTWANSFRDLVLKNPSQK
jgi:hypothetical protein